MSLLDNTTDQGNDQIQIDENKNYFEELVGDGRKFKTPEELAKGKAYADAMIEAQNRRMDELRADYLKVQEELKNRTSVQEMMDQITQKLSTRDYTPETEEERKPVFDPSQIDSLVSTALERREAEQRARQNQSEVKAKLMERYGNNYSKVLEQQLSELGMTVGQMDALAQHSPKAFYKMFGLEGTQQGASYQPPIKNNTRSDWSPSQPKRTYSYYQKMRKERPQEYFSAKTHNQMLQDMNDLGNEFKDSTWRETQYY